MIRKYQQGGSPQLSETQQKGLQYLAQMYTQQTGKDPQQDQEGFMQFIQQLAQQSGVEDVGQLLDMIYQQAQGQAQSARRGAKLNYLKRLSGKCPEGYEMKYFKAGGKVCSKCVAKTKKACGGSKVKMNMCGSKVKKKQQGGPFKNATQINYIEPNSKTQRISIVGTDGRLLAEPSSVNRIITAPGDTTYTQQLAPKGIFTSGKIIKANNRTNKTSYEILKNRFNQAQKQVTNTRTEVLNFANGDKIKGQLGFEVMNPEDPEVVRGREKYWNDKFNEERNKLLRQSGQQQDYIWNVGQNASEALNNNNRFNDSIQVNGDVRLANVRDGRPYTRDELAGRSPVYPTNYIDQRGDKPDWYIHPDWSIWHFDPNNKNWYFNGDGDFVQTDREGNFTGYKPYMSLSNEERSKIGPYPGASVEWINHSPKLDRMQKISTRQYLNKNFPGINWKKYV